jgi:hypothetical protein
MSDKQKQPLPQDPPKPQQALGDRMGKDSGDVRDRRGIERSEMHREGGDRRPDQNDHG